LPEPKLGTVFVVKPHDEIASLFSSIIEKTTGHVPKDEVNEQAVLIRQPLSPDKAYNGLVAFEIFEDDQIAHWHDDNIHAARDRYIMLVASGGDGEVHVYDNDGYAEAIVFPEGSLNAFYFEGNKRHQFFAPKGCKLYAVAIHTHDVAEDLMGQTHAVTDIPQIKSENRFYPPSDLPDTDVDFINQKLKLAQVAMDKGNPNGIAEFAFAEIYIYMAEKAGFFGAFSEYPHERLKNWLNKNRDREAFKVVGLDPEA
jgi:hypothetical protein